MTVLLKNNREGFPLGRTVITDLNDETGIAFSILRIAKGQKYQVVASEETAVLHIRGAIEVRLGEKVYANRRNNFFEELPFCLHFSGDETAEIDVDEDAELAIFEARNEASFPSRVFHPADVRNEKRGQGVADDTSFRFVRTIFDASNSPEESRLVLGEVINLPGRWSSYPPHHHPQPEIYHYRFNRSCGYGHAEHGQDVYQVKNFDTLKIKPGFDHAQCSAPGYGMYYIWVIRHLEGVRYDVPEFTKDHLWVMEQKS